MANFGIYNLLGTLGVVLIVGAYLLLIMRRINSTNLTYSILNAAGAALIVVSLIKDFNFPAFLIEVFWLAISLMGIVMALRSRRAANANRS